ncbi:APC family permease [Hwanghaeella sp.]|uniref:APC family permease n=1 Tax=Hwanghaeella sp. TaxID=2605943 RepID=UPI003CCBF557
MIDRAGEPALKRGLGLVLLTLYGVGVTVGAGIYVLVGKVSAEAGIYGPVAFLIAAVVAGLTALSYGELSGRYPVSAGEAVYLNEAFHNPILGTLVGLMVAMTGLVSAAVITLGFVGYLNTFIATPETITLCAVIAVLTGLAMWGITESVFLSGLITLVEIGGLMLVIVFGVDDMVTSPDAARMLFPPLEAGIWSGVMSGALLAFFAFIGFEDMVNVAEEVRDPVHTMPRAIIATLVLTTTLYIFVSAISVTAIPQEELIASDAPLALVFERTSGMDGKILGGVAVFAVINGALIQMIMGSRILFGLARQGWLPKFLGLVHPGRQTPMIATVVIAVIILILALAFPLVGLAAATSYITLSVFTLVNLALLWIRLRGDTIGMWRVPIWVPVFGAVSSAAMVIFNVVAAFA